MEKFIILVNAGDRILAVPELEKLLRDCEGTTWYQIAAPSANDPESALAFAQDVATLCQGHIDGREL